MATKKKGAVRNKRAPARNKMKNAKPENYFILVTGSPMKNLKELVAQLSDMPDWVFVHHVNTSRNDFSNWIRDVLKEEDLAEDILKISTSKEMEYQILRFIVKKYI